MKKLIFAFMAMTAMLNTANAQENPLLTGRSGPYGTPLFEEIRLEHYMPAFEAAIEESKNDVARIYTNAAHPTFENTIVALERQGELLSKVAGIFFPLNSSLTGDEMNDIAAEVQPLLTDFSNDIYLNPVLFERVKAVYEDRENLDLSPEQRMLLEKTYKGFSRRGAGLSDKDKEAYREISRELAGLTLKFGQNVLAETNEYSLNIPASDYDKVSYMPQYVIDAMAEEAASRGEEGWTVTLQAPSYIPFMTYSKERDLKETLSRTYGSICYRGGEYDNSDNVRRIAELRMRMANLLGYETYADYVLEERMAESRPTVDKFLEELYSSTIDWGRQDVAEIQAYAAANGFDDELMSWDFMYWSEKYKNEKYELNEELLKPYFKLENVEKGVFMLANKLFGITFHENNEIQKYHPEVKVFEVRDTDGSLLSILYMDYFPRESKRGGAWMTNFREMYKTEEGEEVRPLVTLNLNFTKPVGDTPSLLTFDEVVTLLHEFGHGLHGMFAEGTYGSLTGTNVYRDFVELPSQLLENWATEKEFLDMWAVHYETGQPMPAELIQKIIDSKSYLAAYMNIRQLAYGMNDMAWHSITEPVTEDPGAFEYRVTEKMQLLPYVEGMCFSNAFRHIFAGGYAAGYYSYKWSEVLEADAFSMFQENGIFDKRTADLYKGNILTRGGTEHPMALYKKFRGHEPATRALIDKIGEGR